MCIRVCILSRFSCVQYFVTLWTVVQQAPLSMGFSRQKYWSGLPCPPPGDLPDPRSSGRGSRGGMVRVKQITTQHFPGGSTLSINAAYRDSEERDSGLMLEASLLTTDRVTWVGLEEYFILFMAPSDTLLSFLKAFLI